VSANLKTFNSYRMVKNFDGKKFGEKAALLGLVKKLQ